MTDFQTVIIHSVEEVTLSLNCQARLNGLRKTVESERRGNTPLIKDQE